MLRGGTLGWVAGLLLMAHVASGQTPARDGLTVGASVGAASLWDDETHLGRGAVLGVEASVPAGPVLRLGAEVAWFGHSRDSGYLAADGSVLHAMGRASLMAGPRRWRARPYVGADVGLARSTGTLTSLGSDGGPESRRWSLTRAAWGLHLGMRAAAGPRTVVRPEVRVGVIGGSSRAQRVLETPLLRLQGGLTVEWAPR